MTTRPAWLSHYHLPLCDHPDTSKHLLDGNVVKAREARGEFVRDVLFRAGDRVMLDPEYQRELELLHGTEAP